MAMRTPSIIAKITQPMNAIASIGPTRCQLAANHAAMSTSGTPDPPSERGHRDGEEQPPEGARHTACTGGHDAFRKNTPVTMATAHPARNAAGTRTGAYASTNDTVPRLPARRVEREGEVRELGVEADDAGATVASEPGNDAVATVENEQSTATASQKPVSALCADGRREVDTESPRSH